MREDEANPRLYLEPVCYFCQVHKHDECIDVEDGETRVPKCERNCGCNVCTPMTDDEKADFMEFLRTEVIQCPN